MTTPDSINPSTEPCKMCNKTLGNHTGMRHPYTPEGVEWDMRISHEPSTGQTNPPISMMPTPIDPVLRQALITKGVITPDDLTAAEKIISSIIGPLNQTTGA